MNRNDKYKTIIDFYRENYSDLKYKLSTYALVALANKTPVSRHFFEGLADGRFASTRYNVEFRHGNEFKNLGILKIQTKTPKKTYHECVGYVPGDIGIALLEQLPTPKATTKTQLIDRYLDVKIKHERATYSTLAFLAALELGATTNKDIAELLDRNAISVSSSISRGPVAHGYIEVNRTEGRTTYWKVSKKGKELLVTML